MMDAWEAPPDANNVPHTQITTRPHRLDRDRDVALSVPALGDAWLRVPTLPRPARVRILVIIASLPARAVHA